MDEKLRLSIFLKKGELRRAVWDKLDKPKTATDLAKDLKKHRSAISRILLAMEKAGFVKCLNPKDTSFRHYIKK